MYYYRFVCCLVYENACKNYNKRRNMLGSAFFKCISSTVSLFSALSFYTCLLGSIKFRLLTWKEDMPKSVKNVKKSTMSLQNLRKYHFCVISFKISFLFLFQTHNNLCTFWIMSILINWRGN